MLENTADKRSIGVSGTAAYGVGHRGLIASCYWMV